MESKNTQRPIIDRKTSNKRQDNRGVIHFRILLHMAYKNLFFKKLRTTLTILGVIIGIGSIVFLLSFGFGLQDLVSQQVVGSDTVQTIDVTTPRSKILKIDQDSVNQIASMQGVEQVAKSYNTAGQLTYKGSQTESVVYGVDQEYLKLSSLEFASGGLFNEEAAPDQVIVSSSLSKALGMSDASKAKGQGLKVAFDIENKDGVKKRITRELKIAGVFNSENQAEAFISEKHFVDSGAASATQLKVVVPNRDNISKVRKTIESLGFTTTSPLDTVDQINQFFTLFRFVLVGFGGIGMIVAILGMFNTLTISLLERTREIGLMISLGARKQDIKRMFITEALFLSILGGFIGIVGAIIFGVIGNVILTSFAHRNGITGNVSAFVVTPTLAGVTLLLSAVVGLVVVYFPAIRASQTNPIEALHND